MLFVSFFPFSFIFFSFPFPFIFFFPKDLAARFSLLFLVTPM